MRSVLVGAFLVASTLSGCGGTNAPIPQATTFAPSSYTIAGEAIDLPGIPVPAGPNGPRPVHCLTYCPPCSGPGCGIGH
jgi:hypothetical protein